MVVEGQSIRFCQQCGRFQLLDEFDGDRRSCRRKLEKHNERRRKLEGSITDSDSGGEGSGRSRSGFKYHRSGSPPRPWGNPPLPVGAGNGLDVDQMLQNIARDEFLMNGLGSSLAGGMHSLASSGWMPSSLMGGGVAVGSNSNGVSGVRPASHMHPHLTAVLAEVAAANTTAEQNQAQQQQRQRIPVLTSEPAHPTAVPRSGGLTADALLQFLRDGGAGGNGTHDMNNGIINSNNAGTNTALGGGGVPTIKSEPMPSGAMDSAFAWPSNGGSTQYTDTASHMQHINSGSGHGGGDNTRVAALAAAAAAAASADEQQRWDNGSQQQQQSGRDAHIAEMLRSIQSQISNGSNGGSQNNNNTNNIMSNNNGSMPMNDNAPSVAPDGPFHPGAPSYLLSGALGGNPQAPVVGQLLGLLQQLQNANGPPVLPEQDVMTLSLKLFKMTPAQLPPGLLHEFTAWMLKTPTYSEIAMRPGCIHVTTSILSTETERAQLDKSVCNTVQRYLRNTGLRGSSAAEALLLQIQSADCPKAAIVLDGELKMVLDLATADSAHHPPLPSLLSVQPLAATPDYKGSFLVLGRGMDFNKNDRIFCRSKCHNAQIEVINRGAALVDEINRDASGTGGGWLQVAVPHLHAGGYAMEIARGPFVSSPIGFVVLEDPLAVAEVRQLESDSGGVVDVIAFTQKLGVVVQMRKHIDNGVSLTTEMQDETVERIAQIAQEVAAVSLKKGWPAVLRLALPVIAAVMPAAQGLECVSRLLGTGVTPLSAAVVSGNATLVKVLAAWATVHDVGLLFNAEESAASWGFAQHGSLHLVAMLNDPCPIATALNQWVARAITAWSVVPPAAGVSPLSIAASLGQDDLLQMLVLQGVPYAAEALSAMYKQRDLMAHSSPEQVLQQKIKKIAEQQRKLYERDQGINSDTNKCPSTLPRNSFYGDDEGASSSNSPSIQSSQISSPHSLDVLSREPSLMSHHMSLHEALHENDQAAGLDATMMAATIISRNAKCKRTKRRKNISSDSSAVVVAAIAPARTVAATKRSFLLFICHSVLTVLLPALLPERIALGAAVLPALVVGSYTSFDQGPSEMFWSSFFAAMMAVMAVSLNRSTAMAQVRASAFNLLCSIPHVRALLSTLWLLAMANTLGLSRLQDAAFVFINCTLCLVPLPAVSSGNQAWLRMTGAASIALLLAVCVLPIALGKLRKCRAVLSDVEGNEFNTAAAS